MLALHGPFFFAVGALKEVVQIHEYLALKYDHETSELTREFWKKAWGAFQPFSWPFEWIRELVGGRGVVDGAAMLVWHLSSLLLGANES